MGLFGFNEKNKRILIEIGKWLFTAVLIAVLIFYIIKEFKTTQFQLKIQAIERAMPESFIPLLAVEERRGLNNAQELAPYIRFYERILSFFPDRADALSMLGFCYYFVGKSSESQAAFKKANELNPNYFWFNYNLGVIEFKNKNYGESASLMEKAVVSTPQDVINYIGASKVVYRSILMSAPQSNFNIRLNIGFDNAYRILALSYLYANDFPKAFDASNRALRLKLENSADFFYYAGRAVYGLKNYKDAMSYFEESIKRNPNAFEPYYFIGLCLKEVGEDTLSKKYFENSAKLQNGINNPREREKNISLRIF